MALPEGIVLDLDVSLLGLESGDEPALVTFDDLEFVDQPSPVNHALDPIPGAAGTGWASADGALYSTARVADARRAGAYRVDVTRTASSPSGTLASLTCVGQAASGTYLSAPVPQAYSALVHAWTTTPGVEARVTIVWRASAGGEFGAPLVGAWLPVGTTPTPITVSGDSPVSASMSKAEVRVEARLASGVSAGGEVVSFGDCAFAPTVLAYRDGEFPGYAWDGTANASETNIVMYYGDGYLDGAGASSVATPAVFPVTVIAVADPWSRGYPSAVTMAQNAAVYASTLVADETSLDGNTVEPGTHIFGFTIDESNELVKYLNGASYETTTISPYTGAMTPVVVPSAGLRRFIVWDRALSALEVEDAYDELFAEYLADVTVLSWEPPAHDGGSPVTGYLVRAYDGTSVTEFETASLTYSLTGSYVAVQVVAVNAQGEGLPTEIAL